MSSEEKGMTELDETSTILMSNTTAVLKSTTTVHADEKFVAFYSLEAKVAFVTLACMSTVSSLAAITFMRRSKKIPFAAKFMATALLLFDMLYILLTTVNKFISDQTVHLNIQVSSFIVMHLATFTIGLMSVERCFLFLKPMRYIQIATEKFIRKTVISILFCDVCLCLLVRFGVCYIKYCSVLVFTKAGFCHEIYIYFYGMMMFIVLATSIMCYVKIFKCIQSKDRPAHAFPVTATAQMFHSYRSTSIVLIYLVVLILTTVGYCGSYIIFTLTENFQYRIIAVESVYTFNCALNPFLYVLWFKECRMQFVMLLAIFLKRYRQKAEKMRIDVYNIVTATATAFQDAENLPMSSLTSQNSCSRRINA